ncbi:sensor histidine kinase KdpD [Siphonobacter sp. SORGH_AS_1065]|uniref:sensor histidine kinase n=1 Tax=Siphonobacter sp. SORGH_AS_1065 TaxID=3041795 RepID=UPI00277DDB73|nr:HAMP domain-containing sensor histidine kinase [Siphonobacter sp. SORGH_AS_1065]MDQ1088851.1 two-component system phosphate regulon sensor histidine kinase PhoR [Siphonobacter sp. SORGH_AS_1065]
MKASIFESMWNLKSLPSNSTLITLITSCLLVLTTFLGWWLSRSYNEQKRLLAAETSQPFFRSVNMLQDSLVMKRLIRPLEESMREKTAHKKLRIHFFPREDSKGPDTIISLGSRGRVFIASREPRFRRPFPPDYQPDEETGELHRPMRSHLFSRILPSLMGRASQDSIRDSIKIRDLQQQFRRELDSSKINVGTRIVRLQAPAHRSLDSLHTASYQAGLPPRDFYVAYLTDYQGVIFKRLLPQILFSVFLLGLTSGAFLLVFKSLEQQQQLTQLKNDFISNVSHELKTPISTVSVAIEALSSFDALKDPHRTKEYLAISQMELNRLNLLVDHVLRTALFDQKQQIYQFEEINLSSLIEEILHSLKFQFEKHQAQVDFHPSGSNFRVTADRIHLTNVIYNLIDNALKYSNNQPRVTLHLEDQGEQLVVRIQDEGIGIPPQYQQQVFEKFFRVPTGNIHNVKGHGLGLNYVHQVMGAHGGTVTLHSEPGQGSTFVLYFKR